MIICVCNGVNEREIRRTIRHGCSTEESIGRNCGAGTDCGACLETLQDMLSEQREHHRSPGTYSSVAPTLALM